MVVFAQNPIEAHSQSNSVAIALELPLKQEMMHFSWHRQVVGVNGDCRSDP